MNKIIEHLPRLTDKCRDFSRKALETFQGTPSNLTSQGHRGATLGFQVALAVKNLLARAGDTRDKGLIPGLGRSPGEGNGISLQSWKIRQTEEPAGL